MRRNRIVDVNSLLGGLAVLPVVFGVLMAQGASANLITNADMSIDDGVGLPAGWATRQYPFEANGKISARPLGDGTFVLTLRGRSSEYFWEQGGMTLVPGARYRISGEARSFGQGNGKVRVYVRNREWNWNSNALLVPEDTKGEWVRLTAEFEARATRFPSNYWVEICARAGASGTAKAEFRGLRLEALDPETAEASRPMPETRLVKVPARIIPVDPLLARVDAATGRMRFYWSRASFNKGCTLVCSLADAKNAEVQSPFDGDGYAEIRLGRLAAGEHRIAVKARGADGNELAANEYRIVAGEWKDPAKIGRRLNNFVTELVNRPLADGEIEFERAEDGWVWISFDGEPGDARGYLDGCPEAVVFRREGEETLETQRYLKAGRHVLRVKGAAGGRLRIHAVKELWRQGFRLFGQQACSFETFGGYAYALPFLRKYGMVANFNTVGDGRKRSGDPFALEPGYCLGRGMRMSRACMFEPFATERFDMKETGRRLLHDMWPGFSAGLSVDENALKASSLVSVNFSEAVWRIIDKYPASQINVFYCDTSLGNTYDEPRQNVSEISSVINSGNGHGLLCPELYLPVTPTREGLKVYIDASAEFIASAVRMVPAARRKTVLYGASYIMIGEWCNYYSPEADIKVHEADLLRAYATDPRFEDCAGLGFGGIDRGNEEFLRWSMMLLRHYALEGGTEDFVTKYGYAWNPGFVKNSDFAEGLTNWTAVAAEEGGVRAEKIRRYGEVYQHRAGAPIGCGDSVTTFTVSAKGTNRISQKLTGLKPGAYYSVQCNVTDRLPAGSTANGSALAKMPFTFSMDLEGATEVKGLYFNHPLKLDESVPEEVRKRGMMHYIRSVFRADGSEATLVFADRKKDGPAADEGRTYTFNYIIFTPYYCDGDADVREIQTIMKGEPK